MNSWHTLSLLLHLIAAALWLGGILFFLIVFAPAVNQIRPALGIPVLNRGRIALEVLSWAAISLLLITGIINLILHSQSEGAPQGEFYTVTLSVKLFLFFAMLVHHCLQVFKYGTRIASLTAEAPAGTGFWPAPLRALWQRWFVLLKINAGLGPIVTLLGIALIRN